MPLPNFQNPALLQQALTHSSYANEHPSQGPDYDVGQGRSIKEARKNAAIAALRTLKP